MKHIYLNLKRFDVPPLMGGVNRLAPMNEWARTIVEKTQGELSAYAPEEVDFTMYFPEMHLLPALEARCENSYVRVGCQGVYRQDTAPGPLGEAIGAAYQAKQAGFGAFTTNRSASAMASAGVESVLIGHCEERNDKKGILQAAGITDRELIQKTVNELLCDEVRCALARGMSVLYCIGETEEEMADYQKVLGDQLRIGLNGIDLSKIVIAYEPVWSIGPGKTPAGKDYITKIARFVQEVTREMEGSGGKPLDVVYGGGLKQDNAAMLASIPEISGGLIALTRFSGEIGFYPEEYLEIIRLYLGK